MLLELLSDFQISIPELGRIEARTHPVVLLTSNNSRELTEALKRRCLYLWLDYPSTEHELEIVRLHAPELPEQVGAAARRGHPRWCASSTSRSRPRSPSRSTGRARCCCSAPRTSTPEVFRSTMSIIVKHRTDLDTVAERVGVRLGRRRVVVTLFPAGVVAFAEALRAEGLAVGTSELLDAFAALDEVPLDRAGGVPRGARRDAREVAGGPARVRPRLRPLLLPRRRGGGDARRACASRARRARAAEDEDGITGGEQIDFDNLREQLHAGDPRRRRVGDARPRAARDRRLRAPRRGLGRARRRRPAHPPRARPALRARRPAAARPRRPPAAAHARPDPPLRAAPAARARARADRAHAGAAAGAAAERARPRAAVRARCRTSPPCTASSRSSSAGSRPRATRRAGASATRTSTCGARCAPRCRPAASRSCSSTARGGPKRPELYVLCDVSTSVTSASVFFLQRAARAARRVPQDALVRVRRADLRGHRGLRARALLQGGLGRDLAGRGRRRRLAATPTTGASGASSSPRSPTTCTRARR